MEVWADRCTECLQEPDIAPTINRAESKAFCTMTMLVYIFFLVEAYK